MLFASAKGRICVLWVGGTGEGGERVRRLYQLAPRLFSAQAAPILARSSCNSKRGVNQKCSCKIARRPLNRESLPSVPTVMFGTLRYDLSTNASSPNNRRNNAVVQLQPAPATEGFFPPHAACDTCRAKKVSFLRHLPSVLSTNSFKAKV